MTNVTELQVHKSDFHQTELLTADLPPLAEGEALLKIDRFALTANNVTYAASGDMFRYWDFFPTHGGSEEKGIVPVWGFANVVESRSDQLEVGERLYGYWPMATHLVMQPGNRKGGSVTDIAPHREGLPPVYNVYRLTALEPDVLQKNEEARCVLFPLFATSYVLYDWLMDNAFFGAEQVVIGSASSKTAFGLGMLLAHHDGARPATVGLTSPRNLEFTKGLGAYDSAVTYDTIGKLDPNKKTAFIDMSGSSDVITAVHERMGENLINSAIVGATHWDAPRQREALPGAKPTVFFAPAQIMKRDAEWGPGEIMRKAVEAWAQVTDTLGNQLTYEHRHGADDVTEVWGSMVEGSVSPTIGLVLSFHGEDQ